nr:hypothetical protein [Rhodovulum sp. MB263]
MLGGAGDGHLTGGGSDTLCGGARNDKLQGSVAGDLLKDRTGDDLYVVVSTASAVLEKACAGRDRVHATVDWTLGDNLEHLTVTGTTALDGTGNGLCRAMPGRTCFTVWAATIRCWGRPGMTGFWGGGRGSALGRRWQ